MYPQAYAFYIMLTVTKVPMSMSDNIAQIVKELRYFTAKQNLDAATTAKATATLAEVGYQYDPDLFPPLPSDHDWGIASTAAPQTLAEALLWKMGKWKVYQRFASHFSNETSQSNGTDVVFFAFAKHLRTRSNPIFDQHALRALWAIDSGMTEDLSSKCKSVLLSNGEWKPIASGRNTIEAYKLYISRVEQLCSSRDSPSLEALDRLLMPLGQAIKTHTNQATFANWLDTSE
jgi:hypothetical protein